MAALCHKTHNVYFVSKLPHNDHCVYKAWLVSFFHKLSAAVKDTTGPPSRLKQSSHCPVAGCKGGKRGPKRILKSPVSAIWGLVCGGGPLALQPCSLFLSRSLHRHVFHKLCVDPWLNEHCTCPMCKLNILKALGIMVSISVVNISMPYQ